MAQANKEDTSASIVEAMRKLTMSQPFANTVDMLEYDRCGNTRTIPCPPAPIKNTKYAFDYTKGEWVKLPKPLSG